MLLNVTKQLAKYTYIYNFLYSTLWLKKYYFLLQIKNVYLN